MSNIPHKTAGVEDAIGVEAALDLAHQRQCVGVAIPNIDFSAQTIRDLQSDDAAAEIDQLCAKTLNNCNSRIKGGD